MLSDGYRDNLGKRFLIPMLHVNGLTVTNTLIFYHSSTKPSIHFGTTSGNDESNGACRRRLFDSYTQAPIKVESQKDEFGVYVMLDWPVNKKSFTTAFPLDTLGLEYFALTNCPVGIICTYTCSIAAPYDNTDIYIDGYGNDTLQKDQQFSFDANDDLSGTYIRGNNPIAVTCGAIFNDPIDGYISMTQLPPLDSWGLKYRMVFKNSDTGILRIITADGNTVITLFEYEYEPTTDTTLTLKYTYRTVDAFFDPGEVKDITIENNTAYDIEASKPILVAYLPSFTGSSTSFPVVLVFPIDSIIETVYTTSTSSYSTSTTPSCERQSVLTAMIGEKQYFIPYMEIDGIYTSRWMRLNITSTVSL